MSDLVPSGQATLIPAWAGWRLSVDCWSGTEDKMSAVVERWGPEVES